MWSWPLVREFDKLPKGTKLEVTHVFGKMKTLERGSNDSLEHMGDLVIKNNELQEENQMLKNDLIDLNKYDSEKYKSWTELLLQNLIRKLLLNNIFGIN